MQRNLGACLLLVFALIGGSSTGAGAKAGGWKDLAPMAQPRSEAAFAQTDSELYMVGGFSPTPVNTSAVEIYDFGKDSWRAGPPLPLPLNHAMAAAHDDKVYVAGGYLAVVFGATNTAFVLDGGSWSPLPPMPETRAAGAMVTLKDKIYVIGGFEQQGELATTTLVYDIEAGTWSSIPGMPNPQEHLTAVAYRDSIIVIGGRTPPVVNTPAVWRWKPSDSWTELPGMSVGRSGHACSLVKNRFIGCVGGEDELGVFPTAEVLDLKKMGWRMLPLLSPARTGSAAAAHGWNLITAGGTSDSADLTETQSIDLSRFRTISKPWDLGAR